MELLKIPIGMMLNYLKKHMPRNCSAKNYGSGVLFVWKLCYTLETASSASDGRKTTWEPRARR